MVIIRVWTCIYIQKNETVQGENWHVVYKNTVYLYLSVNSYSGGGGYLDIT